MKKTHTHVWRILICLHHIDQIIHTQHAQTTCVIISLTGCWKESSHQAIGNTTKQTAIERHVHQFKNTYWAHVHKCAHRGKKHDVIHREKIFMEMGTVRRSQELGNGNPTSYPVSTAVFLFGCHHYLVIGWEFQMFECCPHRGLVLVGQHQFEMFHPFFRNFLCCHETLDLQESGRKNCVLRMSKRNNNRVFYYYSVQDNVSFISVRQNTGAFEVGKQARGSRAQTDFGKINPKSYISYRLLNNMITHTNTHTLYI